MKHHALVESDVAIWTSVGPPRRWVVLAVALGCAGCLDDVSVPDCIREHRCNPQGGKASLGGSGNAAGLASEAGGDASSPAGGAPPIAGHNGDAGAESEGGVAGHDGDAGASGQGGDQSGTACELCLIREDNLPPPCTGKGYEARLSVQDGDAPFSWQVQASRPGWSITATGAAEAKLENSSPAKGLTHLTVTATSRTGERTTKSFELESREACWFAFTQARESGEGELLLFDPLAASPEAADLAHQDRVFDFAFSPDGQRLAYSYGASPESPRGAHLSLLDLRTLEEQPLTFGQDAVWSFAWSPDGSMLAASYESAGKGYLGAVRMADSAASKAALAPATAFVTTELSWVGSRAVAYHAPVFPDLAHPGTFIGGADNPGGLRTAFWAELEQEGFAAPGYGLETYPPDVTLRAASEGFYMLAGSAPRTIFYAPFESPPYAATRGDISLVSPSGRYAARFAPSTGERLRIDTATGSLDASVVSSADCPLLLAWSPQVERLACVADVWNEDGTTKHGELRLFTLDELSGTLPMQPVSGECSDDVSTLTPSSCARGLTDYAYSTDLARKTARGFSSSGRYFAYASVFDSETFLYLVDLQAGPAALTEALYIARPSMTHFVTRLSFSPDERLLLLQLGSELTLIDVATGKERSVLSTQLMETSKCTEDFAQAPDDYCGSTERAAPWLWAADSKKLVYRTADSLTVADVSAPFSVRQVRITAQACEGNCSSQFGFQPPLP